MIIVENELIDKTTTKNTKVRKIDFPNHFIINTLLKIDKSNYQLIRTINLPNLSHFNCLLFEPIIKEK